MSAVFSTQAQVRSISTTAGDEVTTLCFYEGGVKTGRPTTPTSRYFFLTRITVKSEIGAPSPGNPRTAKSESPVANRELADQRSQHPQDRAKLAPLRHRRHVLPPICRRAAGLESQLNCARSVGL